MLSRCSRRLVLSFERASAAFSFARLNGPAASAEFPGQRFSPGTLPVWGAGLAVPPFARRHSLPLRCRGATRAPSAPLCRNRRQRERGKGPAFARAGRAPDPCPFHRIRAWLRWRSAYSPQRSPGPNCGVSPSRAVVRGKLPFASRDLPVRALRMVRWNCETELAAQARAGSPEFSACRRHRRRRAAISAGPPAAPCRAHRARGQCGTEAAWPWDAAASASRLTGGGCCRARRVRLGPVRAAGWHPSRATFTASTPMSLTCSGLWWGRGRAVG